MEGDVVDEPVYFTLVKVGDEIKVDVPDDSPLNDFPNSLVYLAIGQALGKASDMFLMNAAVADEDDL